jgi:fluoroquinolone transport system ATP-binding protein
LPNHYQKLTALENLAFFRSLYSGTTEDPRHLLELVGLGDDANTRVSQFSKGMQMRLNVARALLNQPDLLFLDEPTSGMDPVNGRRVKDLIRNQKQEGRTVFLTTHNMTVADELCDRVAFIVDGQIPVIASPRELKIQQGTRQVQVEYQANGHLEHANFALDGLGSNNTFLNLLNHEQIATIHTQEASLEDVFIQVTGRSLI